MTARDGTRLACWELGSRPAGEAVAVLLVHGTSLHGRCWAPVAEALVASAGGALRPWALDTRGHGASGRSPDGKYEWARFSQDVIETVDQLGLAGERRGALGSSPQESLVGVGHSAGATALLMAEAARPGTFWRIWAWEPILSAPAAGLREHDVDEMAARARRRRSHFQSVEEARSHLRGRGIFAEFSPPAFAAFMEGAFVPDGAPPAVRLACSAEDEAAIYEGAVAADGWRALRRARCAVRVAGGGETASVPPQDLQRIAAVLPNAEAVSFAGLGHFGPFTDPARVGADISAWLRSAGGARRQP